LPPASDLVFVGDVHLDRDDRDLPAFLAYLRGVAESARRIVLMGDLFNLWLGAADMEQDHHRAVIDCLSELRSRGTELHYLEGNRDYRIAQRHLGGVFDAVSDTGLREDWGGLRIWAAHGDLVNRNDRQYRIWRRVSRGAVTWRLFTALPPARRFAIAERIERKMRGTNVGMKQRFPETIVADYATRHLGADAGAVVLGHFHVERELEAGPGGRIHVYVLPEWKGSRRHLRVRASGEAAFEDV
jgi:UDP-2,3-diacylglucosamine hydrolase